MDWRIKKYRVVTNILTWVSSLINPKTSDQTSASQANSPLCSRSSCLACLTRLSTRHTYLRLLSLSVLLKIFWKSQRGRKSQRRSARKGDRLRPNILSIRNMPGMTLMEGRSSGMRGHCRCLMSSDLYSLLDLTQPLSSLVSYLEGFCFVRGIVLFLKGVVYVVESQCIDRTRFVSREGL